MDSVGYPSNFGIKRDDVHRGVSRRVRDRMGARTELLAVLEGFLGLEDE